MQDPGESLEDPSGDTNDDLVQADRQDQTDDAFVGKLIKVRPLPQPAPPLALPRLGINDVLDQLAGVNATARQRSLDELARWFPGYDFDAAAQTADDRRFSVLRLGTELVDHLRATETMDRIVSDHDLIGGRLLFTHGDPRRTGQSPPRVTHDGPNSLHPNVNHIAVGPMAAALGDEWTAIINNTDSLDPVVSDVCEHLERVYGCHVNCNVYFSVGDARGFGPHWDTHDTIIVPALGSKRWRIVEPTVLSPLRPWIGSEVSDRPVWEGTISAGDALVIPRGWGHEVLGSDDLAVHYTIGINRFVTHQLFQRFEQDAGVWPQMRADVPFDPHAPVLSYESSLLDNEGDMATFVADLVTPDAVDRALATYRSRLPMRLFSSFQDTWRAIGARQWDNLAVSMPVPAGVMGASTGPDVTTFAFGRQLIEVANPAVDSFLALATTEPKRPDELPAIAGDGTPYELAAEVVEAGIAKIVPSAAEPVS